MTDLDGEVERTHAGLAVHRGRVPSTDPCESLHGRKDDVMGVACSVRSRWPLHTFGLPTASRPTHLDVDLALLDLLLPDRRGLPVPPRPDPLGWVDRWLA